MFWPVVVQTPVPGVRIVEPSSSVYDPVPITAAIVGTPTTLPRPSALKPAGNISASDVAVARLGDHLAAVVDPARVLQVAEGLAGDRRDRDLPGAVLRRLVVDEEVELVPRRDRERAPVVVAGLQIAIVDGHDEVAGLDREVVVIGGTVLVDVANLLEAG